MEMILILLQNYYLENHPITKISGQYQKLGLEKLHKNKCLKCRYDMKGNLSDHRMEIQEKEISNKDIILKKIDLKSIHAEIHRNFSKISGEKRKLLLKSEKIDPKKIKEIKSCRDANI